MNDEALQAGMTPVIHYSGDHEPNQSPDGPRAPIPISHVNDVYENATHLDWTIFAVENLRYAARFWRSDASWPKLRNLLEWHELNLVDALREHPEAWSNQEYLKKVRQLLGPRLMARFVRRFFG